MHISQIYNFQIELLLLYSIALCGVKLTTIVWVNYFPTWNKMRSWNNHHCVCYSLLTYFILFVLDTILFSLTVFAIGIHILFVRKHNTNMNFDNVCRGRVNFMIMEVSAKHISSTKVDVLTHQSLSHINKNTHSRIWALLIVKALQIRQWKSISGQKL